ncbi:transposase-like zinc-binding domain-containing protein [Nostoc piscinale]|uniref:IS1/IS1595 family N-terminal zinc-binding domain-containing protein n=1 Tax=Nostoc piscinale TaxID=224012 RepID=UPI000B089998|nr:hypothetical protein [Nostoc piscinale]
MECPRCNSSHIRKNGRQRGKQNYICADCGRQFIEYHNQKGYGDEIKRECLEMYVNGSGFRAIERVKKSTSYNSNLLGETNGWSVTRTSRNS